MPVGLRITARRATVRTFLAPVTGTLLASLLWSLGSTLLAIVPLLVSIPLWLIPPLILVLPPLIWGWLTCRVLGHDVLGLHASRAERHEILRRRRWTLLAMGIICGYLGALPSMMWALSAVTLLFAPLLVLASVWLYTLIFAFAALWFAHYALAELQRLRAAEAPAAPALIETSVNA